MNRFSVRMFVGCTALTAALFSQPTSALAAAAAPAPTGATDDAALRAERDRLAAELIAARERIASLTEQGTRLEREVTTMRQQTAMLIDERTAQARQLQDARVQLLTLQQQSGSGDSARQEALARVELLTRTVEENAQRSTALEAQVTTLERERNRLADELRSAQAAATGAGELSAARAEVARLLQENATLRTAAESTAELQRSLTDARAALATAQAAASSAPAPELAPLRQQLAEANARAEQNSRDLAAARTQIEQLTALRTQLERDLSTARATTAPTPVAAVDTSALDRRIAQLTAERDTLATELASARQAASVPAPMAAAADGDSESLRRQLRETETRLSSSLRAFTLREEEMARLARELETTRNELSAIRNEVGSANAAASSANAALEATRGQAAELAALREQLRLAQDQATALGAEADQLRTRLALSAPPPATTLAAPSRPGLVPLSAVSTPAAPAVAAPPPPAAERTHTVVAGDSLTRIARTYYGNANRWTEILAANRDVLPNPNVLPVGIQLRIP